MSLATGVLAGLAVSLIATRIVELAARRRQLFDVPNKRSSHEVPTPRLGGIGIIAGTVAAMAASGGFADSRASIVLLGGAFVAGVGLVDDLKGTSVTAKLAGQIAGATGTVFLLNPVLAVGAEHVTMTTQPSPVAWVIVIAWIVAICNVVNFMDGTDGLVAGYASVAAISLGFFLGASPLFGALGAGCLGFLVWNRSPASIFMGDSGSQFIGFVLGAGLMARGEAATLPVGILVLAPLLFDTTLTLLRRVAAGRSVLEAHREHLYQKIADRWGQRAAAMLYTGAGAVCAVAAYAYINGLTFPAIALGTAVLAVILGAYFRSSDT